MTSYSNVSPAMFPGMTFDQAHVMLDAVAALRAAMSAGRRPWDDYDDDGVWPKADPKLTESGYRALLDGCESALAVTLDKAK